MSLLLDSRIFLWFDLADPRLAVSARDRIDRTEHVFVSAASVWELTIKRSLGRLPGMTASPIEIAEKYKLQLLPVTPQHAEAIANLPRHHKTPSTTCSSRRPGSKA